VARGGLRSGMSARERILVVDDDAAIRLWIKKRLEAAGMDVINAGDGETGLARFDDTITGVVMDLELPGMDGVACIEAIKQRSPETPCVMVSAADDLVRAVAAMKAGAFDYVHKPLNAEEFLLILQQALRTSRLDRENTLLRSTVSTGSMPEGWVGVSEGSQAVLRQVDRIAASDATVLVTGETGTGKTFLARLIHNAGPRADHPFVTVSCATLPRDLVEAELFGHEKGAFTGAAKEKPGRVQVAGDGTLFLDEIGEMPLSLQPKVLRLLQDREFERVGGSKTLRMTARIIACTNRDLVAQCDTGAFRQDLYFRLSVLPIHIPPLRERREDIEPMAQRFIARLSEKYGVGRQLAPEAIDAMRNYAWPGNVRELQNVLERAFTFATGDRIRPGDLTFLKTPGAAVAAAGAGGIAFAGRTLAEIEREALDRTLEACGGNKARAARVLGISEKSVYNKLKRYAG
jgi:DNA-binding NtrC family response regulator